MSGIIDDELIKDNKHSQSSLMQTPAASNDCSQQLIHQKKQTRQLLQGLLVLFNCEHILQTLTETNNDSIRLKIIFHDPLLKGLTLLLSLNMNLSLSFIEVSTSLLEFAGPYQIQTLHRRILFCKLFSKSCLNEQNKIVIDLHTGGLKIIRTSILSFQQNFTDILKQKNKSQNFQFLVNNAVKDSITIFRVLLKQLRTDHQFEALSKPMKQVELLKSLNSYLIKSPIDPALDVSFGTSKYEKLQKKTKAEAQLTKQMMNQIWFDFTEFQSHLLYVSPDFPLKRLNQLYNKEFFQSNDKEITFLKQRIVPPPPTIKLNGSLESKFIFNIIQINQLCQINMKKFNTGGFSYISLAQVDFYYLLTVSNDRMQKIQRLKKQSTTPKPTVNRMKKLSRKQLVFKSNDYRGIEQGRNRVLHESKIVSKFKGLSSVFFPQYFQVNSSKSAFSQYLIMEYLAYPTLNEYCNLNESSMSFLTKIHLASMIMQSLRFLSSYNIAHMDLKPSNIIVAKRMMIKLIDFGQSYHKDVCDTHFKPAFSMPFGCPQIFDGIGKTEFNQKHDVYSWAVIFFQMLFKQIPFFFSREQAPQIYRQRTYMNYLFFVPEEEQSYGSSQIMTLLRNVIFRSLDTNSLNRPSTIWLTVLLKECLSYLINLEFSKIEP